MTIEVPRQLPSDPPLRADASLLAVYDLEVCPAAFDIIPFLIVAEIARRNAGAAHIHFMLLPREKRSQDGDFASLSEDKISWRVRHIILAALALMPSVTAVSVADSRAMGADILGSHQGPLYPEGYSVERPIAAYTLAEVQAWAFLGASVPTLSIPGQARAFVSTWLGNSAQGRKPISITLRDADNASGNNNSRAAWASFVAQLDKREYFPFVIPDTDRVFEPISPEFADVAHFAVGAVDLELRAAAYELAYLNVMGLSGPTQLCLFGPSVRCLVLNVAMSGSPTRTPQAIMTNFGIEFGHQLKHASPYQRLVWQADDADTIRRYFDLMVRRIESGGDGNNKLDDAFFGPNEESLESAAERAFRTRQWGASRTLYRRLVQTDPSNAEWLYRLGVAETWMGGPGRGMDLLQRAADLGLASADLYLARCEALMFLGRMDQAAANARYGLELDPHNFDAALRLGLIYETHGQFDEASTWLERALAIRPDSEDARAYLAAIVRRQAS